ncbi:MULTISPECIES: effector-associated domain 2-containing protein [unclassified Streptomyces]|uniref:effector-associated domain 2-containing protein n=1 Tax=unclassified Streptomyces TaxID=2593676 RepID=UPI0034151C15
MTVLKGDTAERPALGRLRILSQRGVVNGAGILVLPGVVLTCAHVVASAVGQNRGRPDVVPAEPVLVDAPGRPGGAAGEATVVPESWSPGPLAGGSGGDLAVLRTDWSPPEGTVTAQLGPCGEPDRREVAIYGFPAGAPDGLWSRARLVDHGGPHPDWIQLEGIGTAGTQVSRGFSGAGVWDPAARRVVGMVTAAYTDREAQVAWMLPLEAAARMWPGLAPALGTSVPPPWPPEPPSDRDQFALADALLNVPQIEDDDGAALRGLLPPGIRRAIRTHARPRLQVFFLVQACAEHPDGRDCLIEAVRLLDDASRPARAALELFEELWPVAPGGGAS